MTLMLAVGIPVFLVLGGALLAMSVSHSEQTEQEEVRVRQSEQASASPGLVFFQPMGWSEKGEEVPIEEIVTNIERQLKQKQREASLFAVNPSHQNLHAD